MFVLNFHDLISVYRNNGNSWKASSKKQKKSDKFCLKRLIEKTNVNILMLFVSSGNRFPPRDTWQHGKQSLYLNLTVLYFTLEKK